jgi:ubiquitin-like 1-activating enzyme E1 A
MSKHHSHYFPPTLAIIGGLVAQDVLRALSRKDMPIANLLAVDSMAGTGNVQGWGMGEMKDDL